MKRLGSETPVQFTRLSPCSNAWGAMCSGIAGKRRLPERLGSLDSLFIIGQRATACLTPLQADHNPTGHARRRAADLWCEDEPMDATSGAGVERGQAAHGELRRRGDHTGVGGWGKQK